MNRAKVERFIPQKHYRFVKDYIYDFGYPRIGLPQTIECKIGDVAVFNGKSIGYGNFYVKDRNDKHGRWWVLCLKPKEAFALFEDCPE